MSSLDAFRWSCFSAISNGFLVPPGEAPSIREYCSGLGAPDDVDLVPEPAQRGADVERAVRNALNKLLGLAVKKKKQILVARQCSQAAAVAAAAFLQKLATDVLPSTFGAEKQAPSIVAVSSAGDGELVA